MGKLDGKRAVVTGGTSGIGAATAVMFAREGAQVVFTGRSEEKGARVLQQIRDAGFDASFISCDLRVKEDVVNLHDFSLQELGGVDVLVNNAGVLVHKPFLEHTDEDFDLIVQTNFRPYIWNMQNFIPDMIEAGGGSIINVASISAIWPESNAYFYGSIKAAIAKLTTDVAREFARQGVRINCICPGPIRTPLAPSDDPAFEQALIDGIDRLGRLGEPEDIAYAAVYLASDESSFMTGQKIVLDGGVTISNKY